MNAKTSGAIAYLFPTPRSSKNTIYINVVEKYQCTNSCRFCGRTDAIRGRPNMYEKSAGANLYLAKAPKVEAIMREAGTMMKTSHFGLGGSEEIAFVGLGEPLIQFKLVCETIRTLRGSGYTGGIRVDTNGLIKCMSQAQASGRSGLIQPNPASALREAGLTDIRISVNATNPDEYEKLCRPRFGNAFENICGFVRDCMNEGIQTFASFVVGFSDGVVKTRSEREYITFASSLGIESNKVILRGYIPPSAEEKSN